MTVERQSVLRHILAFRPPMLATVLMLLSSVDFVWALDPSQPANTYLRAHFGVGEGLPGGVVNDIVQSRDGFLWMVLGGTLARFDGHHFNAFEQPSLVHALALAPNGDLWVGTSHDLEQIRAADLNQFDRLPAISYHPAADPNNAITCLRFDRNGILWVGAEAGLYKFENGVFSSFLPKASVGRIEEATSGRLLITTSEGFIEWDGARIVPHPELAKQLDVGSGEIFHVIEDNRGITWFCTKKGIARRVEKSIEKLPGYGAPTPHPTRAYEDPFGNLWMGTSAGLYRATATGLVLVEADLDVRTIYSDRDGNLWVGVNGRGLYRFKDRAVRTFTTADGLPGNLVMTVLATHDGAIWSGFNCGGISRFDGQHFQNYNDKSGLLNSCVWSLAEDANGDLWIGTWGGGAFRFHGGRFTQYSKDQGLPSDVVLSVVAGRDGSVWFATLLGVACLRDGQVRNYTTAEGLSAGIFTLYQDRAGGIWVGTLEGIDRLAGDRFSSFLKGAFPIGEDRAGRLYLTYLIRNAPGGILRIENDRPVSLAAEGKPECMVETDHGERWFSGMNIFRVPPGGLDHPHLGESPLDFEVFAQGDGMATGQASEGRPNCTLSRGGKLWIATAEGLVMLDLPRLVRSDRRVSIYLEEITVGRNQQLPGHELVLPAGTSHLDLSFDAIEIGSPEKIRLQFRLDGVDSQWLDADPPGHAIYSPLPPGTHAFHVRACNRSGIWDRVGFVYYVTQQPYFYQTRWFLAAAIAVGLLMIAGLYQLRVRQVAATLSARFDGRLAERTRIARELHDTLLQTFSASVLRFQSVLKLLPARPEEARQRVESVIAQASNAIAEGRDAVQELRSGALTTADLAESIGSLINELASSAGENPPASRVQVEGTPRNLNPLVRDEAFRIAAEALRNAIRHAEAKHIEVEIRYNEAHLRLRIRDDGKGMVPAVLERGYASGHWGLRGMRERAKLLGGKFEVWSEVGSGTEAELTVPAPSAYAKPARWSIFGRSRRN